MNNNNSNTKNEKLTQSTSEKLQKALDKIERDNLEPSQTLLSKLSGVARRNLNTLTYEWCNAELKKLKEQFKNKAKDTDTNIVKFEPLEVKLKAEINNYRQQNTEYFHMIYDLKQEISKLDKENKLILREKDELKVQNIFLKNEINKINNIENSRIVNIKKVE